jgi:hypothetical protein
MTVHVRLPAAPLVLAVLVFAGGCSRLDGGEQGSNASNGAPGDGAPKPSAGCFNLYVESDNLPETIAMEASISPVIVVGTYRGRGTGFWVTPNGTPPKTDHEAGSASILTKVTIVPDTAIRGTTDSAIQGAVAGGSVDCSSQKESDPLTLENGTRYLFFGTGAAPTDNPRDFVLIFAAWPILTGDSVQTPTEGDRPLAEVIAEIEEYPLVPPGGQLPYPTPDVESPVPSEDNGP